MMKQLFAQEERKVERYINYVRLILTILYVGAAFSLKSGIPPAAFNTIIIVALMNLGYGIFVHLQLKQGHPAHWIRYSSITIDIILLSIVIYSFGSYRTFKTEIFHVYYLWIGLAALRLSPKLTLIAGILSMSIYFLIACNAINSGSVELGSISESYTTPMVSQGIIAIQLISLTVFVMLASFIAFVFRDITAKAIREDLLEEKNLKLNETLHKLRSTQKQLAARNRELATLYEIDALTQLFNRRKIDLIMQEAIIESADSSEPLTLIMLDIDLFKPINDKHGHQIGDRIIRAVADQLRLTARGNDNIGRWGGAEYLIVSPDTDLDAAQVLSERLRKRIESCDFDIKETLTCSFGVTIHRKGETATALLKRADDALQQAKELGRNRICVL